MQQLLLLLLLSFFCSPTFGQTIKIDSATGKNMIAVSFDSVQQRKLDADISFIKSSLDTIKTNTKPPSVLGEYITNKILDKIYDALFGGADKPGLVPFILSLTGLALGLIRFLLLIIRFKKIEGKKYEKIQGIIIAFLLFITSFLLFILTNRNFKSAETIKLDNIENQLVTLQKEMQANQAILYTKAGTDNSATALAAKLDKQTRQLEEIKQSIKEAEQQTAANIENKRTNGGWIVVNCLLVFIVIIILLKDTIAGWFR